MSKKRILVVLSSLLSRSLSVSIYLSICTQHVLYLLRRAILVSIRIASTQTHFRRMGEVVAAFFGILVSRRDDFIDRRFEWP